MFILQNLKNKRWSLIILFLKTYIWKYYIFCYSLTNKLVYKTEN